MNKIDARHRLPSGIVIEAEPANVSTQANLSSSTKTLEKSNARPNRLLSFTELPSWVQDNHYITSHYRPITKSLAGCVQSLSYLHNESVNIYTHLLGCLASPLTGLYLYGNYFSTFPSVTLSDYIALSCFFLGATLCLGMSATFHCISCHSHRVSVLGNSLDYLGIVSLISGSFVPMVHYGFYCEPRLKLFYWSLVCHVSSQVDCPGSAFLDLLNASHPPHPLPSPPHP